MHDKLTDATTASTQWSATTFFMELPFPESNSPKQIPS